MSFFRVEHTNLIGFSHRPDPVRWLIQQGLVMGLLVSAVQAEPLVVGYERFHSETPTADGGAILFSELGCANCHGGSVVSIPRKGPNLRNLSDRVDHRWVSEFLSDPEGGRKGNSMPNLMHGMSDEDQAAVVAYLGTLGEKMNIRAGRYVNAELGSAIYHERGCVACHAPTADFHGPQGSGEGFDDALAVALPDLQKKTSLAALEHFLKEPSKYRPDGRMPHLPLAGQEALDVAAHLLDFQSSEPREAADLKPWPEESAEVIARGQELVTQKNCAACHDLPGIEAQPQKVIKETGGCLSGDPGSGLPRYDLSENQRKSLELFLTKEETVDSIGVSATLAALNCYACHDRNGIGGPTTETNPFFHGEESLGDSGRLPPPLTSIGNKLQKEWLEGVLSGKKETMVRPYLRTRMPIYKQQAKLLTGLLESADVAKGEHDFSGDEKLVDAGRKLLGIQGGVNCITCHNWGDQPSLGIPALDISNLDQRLRPNWFRSYLLDPASYRPGTLMPPLWPGGQSTVPDVLEGDSEKQIAAIWAFIEKGEGVPEGFPDRSGGQFELKPTDRPIIQRTFLEDAGTKAILVGFPGEIHIAYDGLGARPALVWRGAFFDAYSTWYVRAAPIEKPLGEEVFPFENEDGDRRFRGYEVDPAGNPEFLFSDNGRMVRDKFEVTDGVLVRTVSWEEGETPVVAHPKGVEREEKADGETLTVIYSWK